MGLACLFGHKWDGCTCARCGDKRDSDHCYIWKPETGKAESGCVQVCEKCHSVKEGSFSRHQFKANDRSDLVCERCGYLIRLSTDEELASFILTHQEDEVLILSLLPQINYTGQLKRILRHPKSEFKTLFTIFRQLGYTEREQFLESLRGGFKDCLSPGEEKTAIQALTLEDFADIPLTLTLFDRVMERAKDEDFIAELVKAYGNTELIDNLIALLCKKTPSQKLYRYRSVKDGAYWAARCLRLLYAHNLYRDRIAALEGTVIEEPETPPDFDMHDPDAREWSIGYSPKYGKAFDPNEIIGYRFLR